MKVTELLNLLSNGPLLIIIALGIYSITRLITADSILDKPREWFFSRFPPAGYRTDRRPTNKKIRYVLNGKWYDITKGHFLGELVQCPWCTGFWVASFATLFLLWLPVTGVLLLLPHAFRVIGGLVHGFGH